MSTDKLRDPLGFEKSLGKGGSDAGTDAARAAAEARDREIVELRRQFNVTQQNIQPFVQAGAGQLGALTQGASIGGLDERLREIFSSESFQSLIGERTEAVEGQLSAGGLSRSGTAIQEAANIPTSLGFDIENLLTGRSQTLAGSGQNAAVGLGALGAQTSGRIGASLAGRGQDTASGILADQQAEAQGTQNALNLAATVGSIFFSDPALKENIEKISSIGDLSLYQWDWIPETKDTIIGKCGTIGFMADEVKEKYPHHVSDYCGFMTIDYPALLDEMESEEWRH